ncbi:acetylornithine aminotransferase : Acetylornithine aminotransferase OS=Singulisphaera acidiphila (strain ATCC BAA-1392 / DSM 18658 / VKM B-2454 / MOB10) GN=argD PE=3 SV=1: Aminotran_3 [Gemmataceae bacterium]|jgi:predicted acetylornithine/succinylornithine family transaminase|nr:acetylornithine aminotransferase : Acetylornithine aminotransferase OS=Singulisphaera acidiphila (strain ATCC BAA-1392 / DSM 18658 / VKM B-2454 / MOB10) GN=argD PE=3 SV=1: Aminotran_3 [Gemmataceae bacterium]VTT98609.1 acetylornithine aminotransferase : Acetylornithine aminotransferase OS=Singulisphaera acidiphila (strain ATCC BAA-1392 / DSM 18658 / VKM B-2454 / MOB10) GN=argD PE=3 SV=1: Aminotran_3 [Gemmataceae bacterium]
MTTDTLSTEQVISLAKKYLTQNYTRYPVCLVRGENSWVWDAEGNRYLDFFPGWGCGLLGHCPPRVVQAVQEQVASLIHVPNTWYTEAQALLGQALSERTDFGGVCFFCNSGTEANEAAIKLARLNGKPKGRYKIVTLTGGFHGRTMGALTATAQPKYHAGVEPMLPGFNYAPFGDLAAIEKAIDGETCAVMLEPIQGEGGINLPPAGFLEGLRDLCDKQGLLLILDEVQTGMGRTGKWFAHQHWNIKPDIVTLAKALAGGVAMGGLIAKPEVGDKLKPGTHAATFGGNPIAARAALATIETIDAENLLERATQIGERFHARFTALKEKCPLITDVRAKGTMIGVELSVEGAPVVEACLKRGLLINCTHQTVLRLLPALTISDEQIDDGCDIMSEALQALKA